jgi:hypothetical protein
VAAGRFVVIVGRHVPRLSVDARLIRRAGRRSVEGRRIRAIRHPTVLVRGRSLEACAGIERVGVRPLLGGFE